MPGNLQKSRFLTVCDIQKRRGHILASAPTLVLLGVSLCGALSWASWSPGPGATLIVYCIAVIAASLFGGGIPQYWRISHNGMQHIISLVGGFMLGTALFHLLPHALHSHANLPVVSIDSVMLAVVLGIVMTFAMLRMFHHHHHGEESAFERPDLSDAEEESQITEHTHTVGCTHKEEKSGAHHVSWLGVLVGLTIHTLIDGVALAASVSMDATHHSGSLQLFGFGTFLAVFLHKPLDAISITSLMTASGQPLQTRRLANLLFALACPLGAAICYFGLAGGSEIAVSYILAAATGVFLCIALSDLLPEMEFHSHDRFTLTTMLLLGLLAAWMLRFLEGGMHG